MLDRVIEYRPDERLLVEADLDPEADPFLVQHRYKGRPLMPLVASLETMAEVATMLAGPGGHLAAIRDIEIHNGFRFPTSALQVGRATAKRQGDVIQCQWTSDLHNRAGKLLLKNRPYLSCTAEISAQPAKPVFATLQPPEGSFNPIPYPPTEDVLMYHGNNLRALQDISLGSDESWGHLIAPNQADLGGRRQGSRWLASMALLDGCYYATAVALWFYEHGVVSVPARMDRLTFGREPKPGEQCLVHVQSRGRKENLAISDFTLYGEDNQMLLQVVGHTMTIISEGASHATG
jgi:hypothetical protein